MPPVMRAFALLGLAVALGATACPADARTVARTQDGVLAVSGTRESDPVSVTLAGGTYEFDGRGDPLRAGDGCEQRTRIEVACAGNGVTGITFVTGPGKDEVIVGGFQGSEVITVPVTVSSGSGNDSVQAGYRTTIMVAPFSVDAGPGHDRVIGGTAADRLDGGSGVDRLYGGPGADWLTGGAGDDLLSDVDQAPSTLDCGPGADVLAADLGVDALIGCEQPPSEWGLQFGGAFVEHRFAAFRNGTKFTRLRVVVYAGAGATATVTCRGGGCPARPAHLGPTVDYDGRFGLLRWLGGRRLRPGARITVSIAHPQFMTKVVQLTVRRRRKPARETYCVGPISGMVTHHCTSVDARIW
jgi:Ca2+-binding RTX toxin-like protein